jgi:spoIIIJ-associated protein
MNPYERRIIHSALQNDKYVETYSEGEEPYRKVVINYKKSYRDNRSNRYGKNYSNNYSRDYKKDYKEYRESKEKKESTKNA